MSDHDHMGATEPNAPDSYPDLDIIVAVFAQSRVRPCDDLDAVLRLPFRDYYRWLTSNQLSDLWQQGTPLNVQGEGGNCLIMERFNSPAVVVERTYDKAAFEWAYCPHYGRFPIIRSKASFATVAEACHDAERMIAEGRSK